jgi:hypothetical protein
MLQSRAPLAAEHDTLIPLAVDTVMSFIAATRPKSP